MKKLLEEWTLTTQKTVEAGIPKERLLQELERIYGEGKQ